MIEEADDEKVEMEAVTQLAGFTERRRPAGESRTTNSHSVVRSMFLVFVSSLLKFFYGLVFIS